MESKKPFAYIVGKKKDLDKDPSVISEERLEEIKMAASKIKKS